MVVLADLFRRSVFSSYGRLEADFDYVTGTEFQICISVPNFVEIG